MSFGSCRRWGICTLLKCRKLSKHERNDKLKIVQRVKHGLNQHYSVYLIVILLTLINPRSCCFHLCFAFISLENFAQYCKQHASKQWCERSSRLGEPSLHHSCGCSNTTNSCITVNRMSFIISWTYIYGSFPLLYHSILKVTSCGELGKFTQWKSLVVRKAGYFVCGHMKSSNNRWTTSVPNYQKITSVKKKKTMKGFRPTEQHLNKCLLTDGRYHEVQVKVNQGAAES